MTTPVLPQRNSTGWHIHRAASAVVVLACFAMSAVGLYGYGIDGLALHPAVAALIPVGVDLLAICGMYASYSMRNSRWHIRAYSWLVFGVAVVLSMAANTVHAADLDRPMAGVVGAMFPPLLLAFAVHLLIVTRRERDRGDREWASTEAIAIAARAAAGVPVQGTDAHYPACVYRALADDGSPLYIGFTEDLPGRLTRHVAKSPWIGEVTRWSFTAYGSVSQAAAAEVAAIRSERPKYNVVHNREPRAKKSPVPGVERKMGRPHNEDRLASIRTIRSGAPDVTQKQVAKDTGIPLRTVARYWQSTTPSLNGARHDP